MSQKQNAIHVLMIGASGATGKQTVARLLKTPELVRITIMGRKVYNCLPNDERIIQVVVDFDHLDQEFESKKELLEGHNVIISTLGTTRSVAKDKQTYRKIEVEYPVAFARLAKQIGISHAVLLSSTGANKSSFLPYLAQKGEVEREWELLGFDTLTILRPGLLGRGNEMRAVEKIYAFFQKPIPCEVIGQAIANRIRGVVNNGRKANKPLIQNNAGIYAEAAASASLRSDSKRKVSD